MSKRKRSESEFDRPHLNTPVVEVDPVTGHPAGTDTEVVSPVGVLRDIAGRVAAEQPGVTVDEASFEAARAYVDAPVPAEEVAAMAERVERAVAPYPADQTEVKTMVERATARTEERIFRCVYDDHALARKVAAGAKDPDVFCPVCGNRLVRER